MWYCSFAMKTTRLTKQETIQCNKTMFPKRIRNGINFKMSNVFYFRKMSLT